MNKNKTNVFFLVLAAAALVVGAVFSCYWAVTAQKAKSKLSAARHADYDLLIKSEVQTVVTMLQEINRRSERGEYSFTEAKRRGADLLREISYNNDGYFWADTKEGVNVVLYGNKNVEGKNRLNDKINGVQYVKPIIANGQKTGGGFTDYFYPKLGGTVPWAKRSFSLYFKPFNWVVGTGYYVDDVDRLVTQKLAE